MASSAEDRFTFLFTVLKGYKVEVQLANGLAYEGIFNTANFSPDVEAPHGVVLKYARCIRDPSVSADRDGLAEKPSRTKVFNAADIVQLLARDVRMNPEDLAASTEDFETDAAISRGRGG
jgi:hypothetical protein